MSLNGAENVKRGYFKMAEIQVNSNNVQSYKQKFAEMLSQLRKERGYSQKKVASDLGISQALLSHYEKGVRECGLDFVARASEYYGVTTDYLLGVSSSRFGMDENYIKSIAADEDLSLVNVLSNATKILVDTAISLSSDSSIAKYLHDYDMLCLYRGALTLAKVGALPMEIFKLDYTTGHELATAAIAVLDARFAFIEDKSRSGEGSERTDLNTIIEQAEEYLLTNFIS